MRTHNEPNERIFDDLITIEYITTNKNDYRLTVTYIGAYDEDDEPNPESATGAIIELFEVTGRNPETITAILEAMREDFETAGLNDELIYINRPETRLSCYFEDYTSADHTREAVERIKKQLEALEG